MWTWWLVACASAPEVPEVPDAVEVVEEVRPAPWHVRGPDGVATERVLAVDDVFTVQAPPELTLEVDRDALARVARDTVRWLRAHPGDPAATGSLLERVRPADATLATLEHLAAEDWRLEDFATWRWTPDQEAAEANHVTDPTRIRQTRYLVYESPGSTERTAEFSRALYAAPPDPLALTRPQIYAGAYEEGGSHAGQAAPLVWMRPADVNKALMQGTVAVQLVQGGQALFNVHVHNGHAYVRGIRAPEEQPRYWYFRPVDGVLGYGQDDKIRLEPNVAVAADVYGLGVGTVLLLVDEGVGQVVVVADTGGAFQPNFFQLDRYTGQHADHAAFEAATADVPPYVDAWVLVREL